MLLVMASRHPKADELLHIPTCSADLQHRKTCTLLAHHVVALKVEGGEAAIGFNIAGQSL